MFIHGSVNLDITIGDLSMEGQDAAPIIHQFYANPNPLEDVPPLTVELCYQVENPAGGATTMTITDITHGVSVPGPFVADNALHCVSGVNIPSAPVTFLLDAEKGCIGSNATVTITIESCTKPAPTLHQFYAYPNPLRIPPPQTVELCYQVENPAGGNTVISIMDTTHGVPVPGLLVADNALHCVTDVNIPGVPNDFSLSAKNDCQVSNPPDWLLTVTYQKADPLGKVPGLTGVGALILALVLAVFAVSRLRKKRSSG